MTYYESGSDYDGGSGGGGGGCCLAVALLILVPIFAGIAHIYDLIEHSGSSRHRAPVAEAVITGACHLTWNTESAALSIHTAPHGYNVTLENSGKSSAVITAIGVVFYDAKGDNLGSSRQVIADDSRTRGLVLRPGRSLKTMIYTGSKAIPIGTLVKIPAETTTCSITTWYGQASSTGRAPTSS
jgi:hypothetical protein